MTVLIGLKAWNTLTIYSVGSFDRISVVFTQTINFKGSVFGMTDFKLEDKGMNSCLIYGYQRLGRITF